MRKCSICGSFLVPCNESIDHIGVSVRKILSYNRGQYGIEDGRKFVCQSCLYAIQNQVEYGISSEYAYAEV